MRERRGRTEPELALASGVSQPVFTGGGGIGDVGSFSFQSSKNLNSGEGGILVTNDDELAARCRSIHNCGRIAGGAETAGAGASAVLVVGSAVAVASFGVFTSSAINLLKTFF